MFKQVRVPFATRTLLHDPLRLTIIVGDVGFAIMPNRCRPKRAPSRRSLRRPVSRKRQASSAAGDCLRCSGEASGNRHRVRPVDQPGRPREDAVRVRRRGKWGGRRRACLPRGPRTQLPTAPANVISRRSPVRDESSPVRGYWRARLNCCHFAAQLCVTCWFSAERNNT